MCTILSSYAIVAVATLALQTTTLQAAGPLAVLNSARTATGGGIWRDGALLVEIGSEHANGLDGQWRMAVDVASGRFHQTSDFQLFQSENVWDGHDYWRRDKSGGVHPVNSAFMQAIHVTDAWIAARGYLRRDALGAELEKLNEQHDDGQFFEVVRATPLHGAPVELWFDRTKHLLSRTVQIMPIDVHTVRYQDYRRLHGTFVPFKITADDGIAANAETVQISRIEVTHIKDGEFRRPSPPEDFTIDGDRTAVPIEFDGDVVVEAKLNGKGPFAFILDTGGHDILTPAVAIELGLHLAGAGESGGSGEGTAAEQYSRVDRVDIGGLTLRNQSFTIIPLQFDTIERGPRPPLAGILGLELFERLAMKLDYRHSTLTIEPLPGYRNTGSGRCVPIVFSDDAPLLAAKIDGAPGDVQLDTGNSGTLVVQGIWADSNGLTQRMMNGFPSLGFGMGGASPNWTSRVAFAIAGQEFPRTIARYAKDKKGAFSSRTESGNVGNEILANFTLDFDYGHDQICFTPAPGYVAQPFTRAGVTVYKERAEAFRVAAVAAGTPAAEAGLKVNDEIIAVDDRPAKQLSGWDFRRAMREPPGVKVTLSVMRQGQTLVLVLTLRELLT